MTLNEFIDVLKSTRKDHSWILWWYGHIRGETAGGDEVCPITAVHRKLHKRGRKYPPLQYDRAGESIGLSPENADKIADAADSPIMNKLRQRILKALDLKEE